MSEFLTGLTLPKRCVRKSRKNFYNNTLLIPSNSRGLDNNIKLFQNLQRFNQREQ